MQRLKSKIYFLLTVVHLQSSKADWENKESGVCPPRLSCQGRSKWNQVCVLSHGVWSFLYQKYLSVGKTLVTDEIISTWGIPAKPCNDCATYLNGQILKYSCKFWSIIQSFHSTYDLQTFSLTSDYQNWLQLLTLLAKDTPINSTKSKIYLFWRAQLSPNKIITRHPTNVGEVPHNLSLLKGDITYHQKGL